MRPKCICGCGKAGKHRHHVVTRQKLRELKVRSDERDLVWVALECHNDHHRSPNKRLPLHVLPDGCFVFAVEKMGLGPAYEYLRRHYAGEDERLDVLLETWERER